MMVLYILLAIVYGISWVLQVVVSQIFFDRISFMIEGEMEVITILKALIVMGITYIFAQFMNGVFNYYGQISNMKLGKEIDNLFFKRVDHLAPIEYEDTKRLDDIHKAESGSKGLFWVSTTILDIIFFYGTYFLFMSGYLYTFNPILGFCIVIIFIPCIFSKLINSVFFRNLEEESAPIKRKVEYYKLCMVDKEFYKETRILGATAFFKRLYIQGLKKLNHLKMNTQLKKSISDFMINIVTVFSYGVVLYMLFLSVMNQQVTVGAFAAILTNLGRIYNLMDEVISERFGWASENIASVENFLNFIQEDEKQKKQDMPKEFDIRLKHIGFTYPMSKKEALSDISLTLYQGQTVALVGENGSGKTTLCRVLMGLYQPDKGEIFYGDHLLSTLELMNISAVFQKYCRYKMTVSENIQLGEFWKKTDEKELKGICKDVGIHLEQEHFTNGIHTMLGREFDGIELSGVELSGGTMATYCYSEGII